MGFVRVDGFLSKCCLCISDGLNFSNEGGVFRQLVLCFAVCLEYGSESEFEFECLIGCAVDMACVTHVLVGINL